MGKNKRFVVGETWVRIDPMHEHLLAKLFDLSEGI